MKGGETEEDDELSGQDDERRRKVLGLQNVRNRGGTVRCITNG